jgi:hypothetical protein
MNNKGLSDGERPFQKNVVKRGKGVNFAQVIEKSTKINFKKCPIYPMRYDIMVLQS